MSEQMDEGRKWKLHSMEHVRKELRKITECSELNEMNN